MAEGLTMDLMKAGLLIWLLGVWLVSRDQSIQTATIVASIKVAIPIAYFAWFFDGTWTLLDDLSYYNKGQVMLQLGYNPLTELTTSGGRQLLFQLAGGGHILYYWWNLLGQYLFGGHYYAPVFLNIFLTFIGGRFLLRIACECGFSRKYACLLQVFFLLHWDLISWSSFLNLKDILVMTLTIIALFCMIKLTKRIDIIHVIGFVITLVLLSMIRFYVPYALGATLAVVGTMKWYRKIGFFSFVILPLIVILPFLLIPHLILYKGLLALDNFIYGVIRFVLTPMPWKISKAYSFLFLPSILHLTFVVPALFVGFLQVKESHAWRVVAIYFVVLVLFYGITPELQGPRHRVQISFVFIMMQFHFLRFVARRMFPTRIYRLAI